MDPSTPPAPWRRYPELWMLALLVLVTTPVFWLTDLDVRSALWFYDAGNPDQPWLYAQAPLWRVLYTGGSVLAGLIGIGGLLMALASRYRPGLRLWGPRGIFLFLMIVLGSGLVVNVIFKDHYGRYRPRQIEACGGVKPYLAPLVPGERGEGKSFPCGHCSAGFALLAFWFIWRRQRPRLARAALAFGIGLGLLFGVGRMAAGGHFLSDALWAGYLMFLIGWLVYYRLLKVPVWEDRLQGQDRPTPMTWRQKGLAALASVSVLVGAAMAKPMNDRYSFMPAPGMSPSVESIVVSADDVTLHLRLAPMAEGMRIDSQTHSFGLPGNKVDYRVINDAGVLSFHLSHQGLYTERDTVLRLVVDPAWAARLKVRLEEGDIYVAGDAARSTMDLVTRNGKVYPGQSQ